MAHNLLHSEVVFVLIFVAVFVCLLACLFVFAQDSVHMGFILSRSQEPNLPQFNQRKGGPESEHGCSSVIIISLEPQTVLQTWRKLVQVWQKRVRHGSQGRYEGALRKSRIRRGQSPAPKPGRQRAHHSDIQRVQCCPR